MELLGEVGKMFDWVLNTPVKNGGVEQTNVFFHQLLSRVKIIILENKRSILFFASYWTFHSNIYFDFVFVLGVIATIIR